ncbi:MAG TPA: four helix bundle protein [Dissulfurispiraceae bacterium]|nr:four helix bundle protein [Dissulfurispiraceae bacterium]
MAKIERFEDIQAWQEARELTKTIYRVSATGQWAKDFGLRDQIRRAAISVMSNVAEGFDRQGDAEFGRFLSIAKGSASEIKAQLYVALDQGYLDAATFNELYESCDKVVRFLGGFIRYLSGNRDVRRSTHDAETKS